MNDIWMLLLRFVFLFCSIFISLPRESDMALYFVRIHTRLEITKRTEHILFISKENKSIKDLKTQILCKFLSISTFSGFNFL